MVRQWVLRACRLYGKALQCIPVLRQAAVDHKKGQEFNSFLEKLAEEYEHHRKRSAFWKRVVDAGFTLISDDEAEGTGVAKAQALDWLKAHTPGVKVCSLILNTECTAQSTQSNILHVYISTTVMSITGVFYRPNLPFCDATALLQRLCVQPSHTIWPIILSKNRCDNSTP
jgi:Ku C terminal domain like